MNNKHTSYLVFLIFIIIVYFLELQIIDNSSRLTKYFEFQLLSVYGYAQIQSIRKFGMFNFYTLVLVGFFIFAIGGILHFFLSDDNILQVLGGTYGDFYFTNEQIQLSLLIYTLFIGLTYLTYRHLYRNIPNLFSSAPKKSLCYHPGYFRLGKCLMWGFLAIEIYKGYLYFSSFSIDRVLIYLYGNSFNPVPTWVRFLATFFEMGYAFILCSMPDSKTFKRYSALYFVVLIPEILLGNRGLFGAFLLFVFWYYAKMYNPKPIKTRHVVILGVVMLTVFQAMQFYRDGASSNEISYSMTLFLKGQSISFFILPLYMQYAGAIQYYIYPFVLYNLIGGFSGYSGQSIEVLQHNCGVGHQLMYTISPDAYLAGASLGSSSIVELYDLGIWGIIIGAMFFPVMIAFFEKKFVKSRFAVFFSYSLFSSFVLSARGSYFPSLYAIFKFYIFFIGLIFIYDILTRGKQNKILFFKK